MTSGTSNLTVASGHAVDIDGGTLQGVGTIHGNLVNDGGTISPGLSGTAGTLRVTGTFTDPMSTLDIKLFSPTSFDVLSIGGTASLNGATLDLSLAAGFMGTTGDMFTILTSAGLTGEFSDNTIVIGKDMFTVTYTPDDVVLDLKVASVPEPASLVMLVMGMAGEGVFAAIKAPEAGSDVTDWSP